MAVLHLSLFCVRSIALFVLYMCRPSVSSFFFFFFNDTATTEIYTLSLHDALPIYPGGARRHQRGTGAAAQPRRTVRRSEEHTSELQSRLHLVCRLLLEKKKKRTTHIHPTRYTKHPRTLEPTLSNLPHNTLQLQL